MRGRKLSDRQLKRIVQLARYGTRPADIAQMYDISVEYVRKLARDDRRKRQKHRKTEEYDDG